MTSRRRTGPSSLQRDLVAIRRDLHTHPELGYQEKRTSKRIVDHLRRLRLAPRRLTETGVVADVGSVRGGKRLMLRADMDALPIRETTGLAFASQTEGVMHACGHDLHVAMLLGAARLLRDQPVERGAVRLCFQPAEEGLNGASAMIRAGVLRGVDAALGCHVWQPLPVGKVAALTGPAMAAVDEIRIRVEGKGSHAAAPHRGVDPIVVAAHLVTAMQTIVSRRTDPFDSAVVTIGQITGGSAFNVIPEHVDLLGTVRTFRKEVQKDVRRRMVEIVRDVCRGFGARGVLEYVSSNPATVNDAGMADFMRDTIRSALGSKALVDCPPTMGGEDFAFYGERVPSCFVFVGSGPRRGPVFFHHHPKFNPDEDVLEIGAHLMSEAARRWLGGH